MPRLVKSKIRNKNKPTRLILNIKNKQHNTPKGMIKRRLIMNKIELKKAVSAKTGATQKDIEPILDAIFDVITEELAKKESVSIVGFGKFETTDREAREGRNPKTGEPIAIAAASFPKFKAYGALKEAINQ